MITMCYLLHRFMLSALPKYTKEAMSSMALWGWFVKYYICSEKQLVSNNCQTSLNLSFISNYPTHFFCARMHTIRPTVL